MKFPIGFAFYAESEKVKVESLAQQAIVPVKSLVQVYFPERGQMFTYFNDQFDLKQGDFVFVDGKLEGIRGIVREVNKNFKIKVAAMLQLKDILEKFEKNYPDMHQNYFAAVEKLALFRFVIQLKESGSFVL